MTANNQDFTLACDAEPTCDQSWSLARLPCWAPWIVCGIAELENGIYEIEDDDWHYDCELSVGQIEIYDHPERGQSYWDDMADDGTDFAGHVSTAYLAGKRVRRLLPNSRLARADGFEGFAGMMEFFQTEHGLPFTGVLIEWAP